MLSTLIHRPKLGLRLGSSNRVFQHQYMITITSSEMTVAYRDRLRDVLLENVPVQWGKKLVRYEETDEGVWINFDNGSREFCDILVDASGVNSPVRKQKYQNYKLMILEQLLFLIQKTLGLNGDSTLIALRLIPIEQDNSDELHYRTMIAYFYSSELDNEETEKFKVDDNNPASVVEHLTLSLVTDIMTYLYHIPGSPTKATVYYLLYF
ncbi:unnamed protein product [Rhizophagus irregularis]|nr:unnamed protein product [Rhizophagus irregularis]